MLTNFIIACTALLYIHIKSYTGLHVSIFEITNEKMRQIPKKGPANQRTPRTGNNKTSMVNKVFIKRVS